MIARVSQIYLFSKIKYATSVFPLVRVLGPPEKNFSSFRVVLGPALEFGDLEFSKGGPLVTSNIFFSQT